MNKTTRKRGSLTKGGSQLISVWLPKDLCAKLDELVKAQDTDRSKLIRQAIRAQSAA